MTATFFPPFGESTVANMVNFVVNANPVAFAARGFFLTQPDAVIAPLGILNDMILQTVQPPDNLFDPTRQVQRPLQVGDRVRSPNRQIAASPLFGAYILAFVPVTNGSINLWDGAFITYDPLDELEPQPLHSLWRLRQEVAA